MFDLQPLSKEVIDAIFEAAESQSDYVIELYKVAYPAQWDSIEKVKGWPHVSKDTNEYLFSKAIAFDKEHHPNVVAGGIWMNNGFGSEREIPEWFIQPTEVILMECADVPA